MIGTSTTVEGAEVLANYVPLPPGVPQGRYFSPSRPSGRPGELWDKYVRGWQTANRCEAELVAVTARLADASTPLEEVGGLVGQEAGLRRMLEAARRQIAEAERFIPDAERRERLEAEGRARAAVPAAILYAQLVAGLPEVVEAERLRYAGTAGQPEHRRRYVKFELDAAEEDLRLVREGIEAGAEVADIQARRASARARFAAAQSELAAAHVGEFMFHHPPGGRR